MANAAATWCSGKASRTPTGSATAWPGCWAHENSFAERKLHLGYRAARLLCDSPLGSAGATVRGHEFHYASLVAQGSDEPCVDLVDGRGHALGRSGGRRGHVTGTFFHAIAQEQ